MFCIECFRFLVKFKLFYCLCGINTSSLMRAFLNIRARFFAMQCALAASRVFIIDKIHIAVVLNIETAENALLLLLAELSVITASVTTAR